MTMSKLEPSSWNIPDNRTTSRFARFYAIFTVMCITGIFSWRLYLSSLSSRSQSVSSKPHDVSIRLTHETIAFTDYSWLTIPSNPPAGFESPSFDDSEWVNALQLGPYGPTAPWYSNVRPDLSSPHQPIFPILAKSNWIWTEEMRSGRTGAYYRPFRKTIVSPAGKIAVSAEIGITTDDIYDLYVNGRLVGSTPDPNDEMAWTWPQAYTVKDLLPHMNVIAIRAKNRTPGAAAVLAAISISYANDAATKSVNTSLVNMD